MSEHKAPTMLKVPEVADRLRIGLTTAYRLCRQEEFPAARVRGQIRVPSDRLDAWIERQGGSFRPES